MNYAEIKYADIADGPGVRVSLFVSGCTHHCKGCFNQMTWDFNYGKPFDRAVENALIEGLRPFYVTGLTLLGGEPLEPENQKALLPFLRRVKQELPDKNIWCYSGYVYEKDIAGRMFDSVPETRELFSYLDVLVDGPFIQEKKNITLQFRGSENQRLIDVQKTLEKGEVVLIPDNQ